MAEYIFLIYSVLHNMTLDILLAIAEIFGLFSIGIAARLLGRINDQDIDRWSRFVLDFIFPAFIFNSIIAGFKLDRLNELWPLPVIGLGLVIFGTIAGRLLTFGLMTKDKDNHRSFIHFCAVNNSAYLPIIIIRNIFGEPTLANLFFFNLGTTIGIWTIGVSVLGATDLKNGLKNLLTPTLFSILVALLLLLTNTYSFVPSLVTKTIDSAASAAVPLMLILIGASLAHRSALHISWQVVYITVVRLIILPLIAILILRLLPISKDVFTIAVIVSLMPVAVSSVIMTRRFGGNPNYATSSALFTTIASILTIPVALFLLFDK